MFFKKRNKFKFSCQLFKCTFRLFNCGFYALAQSSSPSSLESCTRACRAFFVEHNLYAFNKRMSELHNVPSRWISKVFFFLSPSPAPAPQVKERSSCTLRMSPGAAGASSKVSTKKGIISSDQGFLSPSARRRLKSTTCPCGRRCLGTPTMRGGLLDEQKRSAEASSDYPSR